MTLSPDHRRLIRTIVHTAGALVMLGYLGWIIFKSDGGQLTLIGLGLVAILFVRELLHGWENISARRLAFKFGANGAEGEIEK